MGETLDELHRVLTLHRMTPIERCALNEHEIEDGTCLTCAAPRCDCGRVLNPRDKCASCDNPYSDLPADDPRRFSFDLPREDNPTPFGFDQNDRIRSKRGPRVAAGKRG